MPSGGIDAGGFRVRNRRRFFSTDRASTLYLPFARHAGEVGRGRALALDNFGQKVDGPSEPGPTSEAYNVVGLIEGICDAVRRARAAMLRPLAGGPWISFRERIRGFPSGTRQSGRIEHLLTLRNWYEAGPTLPPNPY
jgi:hypothetical protein